MTDSSEDPPAETAMQRALRLKKAAQEARSKAPGRDRPEATRGVAAGASKPWMKR
ncbi:MAG: hypothetical protein ABW360_05030 [Phenylobacterium sp.]